MALEGDEMPRDRNKARVMDRPHIITNEDYRVDGRLIGGRTTDHSPPRNPGEYSPPSSRSQRRANSQRTVGRTSTSRHVTRRRGGGRD